MDEKKALIAVAVSFLILFAWFAIFPPPKRPVPETVPAEQAPPTDAGPTETAVTPPPPAVETEPLEPVETVAAAAEETVTLASDLFTATLTNRGGRLLSFELVDYTTDGDQPLGLLPAYPPEQQRHLGFDLDDRELGQRLNDALFVIQKEDLPAGPDGPGQRVVFTWADGHGLEARKSVTAWRNRWLIDVELEVIDRGRRLPARLALGPGFAAQEQRGSRTYYYGNQALWFVDGRVDRTASNCGFLFFTTACRDWKSAIKRDRIPRQGGFGAEVGWVGLEDQFFTALVLPGGAADVRWTTVDLIPPVVDEEAEADGEAEAQPQPLLSVSIPEEGGHLYIGPKKYRDLEAYGVGLEKTVWFSSRGWLAAIVRAMYLGLLWIHDHTIANWGMAIILTTFLLRLALFPLNQYAMVKMKRTQVQMQKLQPKIKAIRSKFAKKKDAQSRAKMNEEMMALYRKEGVNPMGGVSGCLPLLAQFPILIGFYNMLTVAVELRGAPFVLWVQDLSQPDPYWIIPLAMGATMFLQQRMTMSKITDPVQQQQQKFMMFMPFMFTFFCLQMPSGMVLYWFVNNVLGIGQQWLVNRHTSRAEAAA